MTTGRINQVNALSRHPLSLAPSGEERNDGERKRYGLTKRTAFVQIPAIDRDYRSRRGRVRWSFHGHREKRISRRRPKVPFLRGPLHPRVRGCSEGQELRKRSGREGRTRGSVLPSPEGRKRAIAVVASPFPSRPRGHCLAPPVYRSRSVSSR